MAETKETKETKQEITFDEFYNDLTNNWEDKNYIIQKINDLDLKEYNFLPYQKKILEGVLLRKQGKGEEACVCFQESNEMEENCHSIADLAYCYQTGKYIKQNIVEAIRLYNLAIEKGSILAYYNLGCCYYLGEGVEKNFVEAIKLYKVYFEKSGNRDFNNLIKCYNKLSFNQKYEFYNSLSKNSPVLEQIEKENEIDCLKFKIIKMENEMEELKRLVFLPPYADTRFPNGGPGFQHALLSRNDFDE